MDLSDELPRRYATLHLELLAFAATWGVSVVKYAARRFLVALAWCSSSSIVVRENPLTVLSAKIG